MLSLLAEAGERITFTAELARRSLCGERRAALNLLGERDYGYSSWSLLHV